MQRAPIVYMAVGALFYPYISKKNFVCNNQSYT